MEKKEEGGKLIHSGIKVKWRSKSARVVFQTHARFTEYEAYANKLYNAGVGRAGYEDTWFVDTRIILSISSL